MDVIKTKELKEFIAQLYFTGKMTRWAILGYIGNKAYPCTCQDEENEYENYKKPGF